MFKQDDSSNKLKIDSYFFQLILLQNVRWFLPWHRNILPRRGFILKQRERPLVALKNGTRDFKIALDLRGQHVFMLK